MSPETHSQMADFIWSICNLLRGPYKRNEYRKVILPLTVLRRFDCILEPTKQQVLDAHKTLKGKSENIVRPQLSEITGTRFYNLSKLDFVKLLDDPNQIAPNLNSYINAFSPNVRQIMERFDFGQHVLRMSEKNLLFEVVRAFSNVDLSPERIDNMQMGYIFEELIRIGAEQSNEEAGEHFTPREVIWLMVNLLLSDEPDLTKSYVVKTIYDPACGTGGMLSSSEQFIHDYNSDAKPILYGQDWNDEAYAICKSDMLIKGEDADSIKLGDTFSNDGFPDRTFDYILANPPFVDSEDYQILLVANKYQTGFDQPLLQTMYVDKRLAGVQAVQTLSRLNRTYPGKETSFVLDFVNEPDEIYAAFKPYYDTTILQDTSEPAQLETLKYEMDEMQVYHWSEIEGFAGIFYKPMAQHNVHDHARMEKHLQPSVDRFKTLDDDEQQQSFRDKLSSYVHLYTFLSQIMPWTDPDLEKLYSFGRFLLPHLPTSGDVVVIRPEDDVALRYYRLERVSSGVIDLDTQEVVEVKSPTDVGTGKAQDEDAPLSDIIGILNEQFGTEFNEEDRLFFQQIKEKACGDEQVVQTANANPLDKFELGIRQLVESFMIQRMSENDQIVSRYMDDREFQNAIFPLLAKEIFTAVRERQEDAQSRDLRAVEVDGPDRK